MWGSSVDSVLVNNDLEYEYLYILGICKYDIKDRYMWYKMYMQTHNLGVDYDKPPTLDLK